MFSIIIDQYESMDPAVPVRWMIRVDFFNDGNDPLAMLLLTGLAALAKPSRPCVSYCFSHFLNAPFDIPLASQKSESFVSGFDRYLLIRNSFCNGSKCFPMVDSFLAAAAPGYPGARRAASGRDYGPPSSYTVIPTPRILPDSTFFYRSVSTFTLASIFGKKYNKNVHLDLYSMAMDTPEYI